MARPVVVEQPRSALPVSAPAPMRRFGAWDGADHRAAAAAADADQRLAMDQQRRRRLGHERHPARGLRAARHAGPACRRGARGRGAAHRNGARHPAGPGAARRAGEDAQPPGVHGVRLRPAVPCGDRQARRCDHPAAARAASARTTDRGTVRRAEAGGHDVARPACADHRPQWPDPGDLAAHRRGVRRSSPDHRSGRGGASSEAGAATARRGRRPGAAVRHRTGSSSISNVRSRRGSNSPSMRWAFPGSTSVRPRRGTIRWAAPRRR